MSTVYKVNASGALNIRSGPGVSYGLAGSAFPYNTTLRSENNETKNGWIHITSPVNGWCSGVYLTKVTESTPPPSTSQPPAYGYAEPDQIDYSENYDTIDDTGKTIVETTVNTAGYKTLFYRYIRAFGCPPQFNMNVDIQYINDITPGVGRAFANSMLSNPSILSLCPGTVNYLPGFSKDQKNAFYERVLGITTGDSALKSKILSDNDSNVLNGKLYEFKQNRKEYMNVVNYLCRMMAILMGIGDEKIPYGTQKLKNFNYDYWLEPEKASATNSNSVFGDMKGAYDRLVSSAVGDNSYVHFFVTNQGTSVNENISTDTTASQLEEIINNSSLNSVARNLEFLFGGPIGSITDSALENDLQSIFNGSENDGFIKSFMGLTKNYFKGGRLVFPQMVDGVNYSKSMSCSLKFTSLYGNKLSIFLRCMVPIMHLLALSLPKQLSNNMYTYPFIVRAFQKGWFNSDLAIITNMNIVRGGPDNTSWTVHGIPTEFEVTFDITPLYSQLMVSSTAKPFLALQNTALVEYLGTLCGVDLKMNNLNAKIDIATAAIKNKFTDIPANEFRGITDSLSNALSKIFQIQNR